MISAVFFRKSGCLLGFDISGHAFYDSEGSDVVCAAVSSAVQLTCNTITDFLNCDAKVNVKGGHINLRLDSEDPSANALLSSFAHHIKLISEDYSGTITITFSEV